MTAAAIEGKVALVTGGSRGIGRAIALALARAGADVAVNFRAEEKAALEVCAEIEKLGRRSIAVKADVSMTAAVAALVSSVEDGLGDISILVNNAGIAKPRPLDEVTEELWDETMANNLKSCFLVSQAVLPGMRARRWGRIVNLSSAAARVGGVVGPHYAASKAGIEGLTHSYASLLVKEGITVNAIAPALVLTDMVRNDLRVAPDRIPMGRFGTVDEVAAVAVMLVENGYMTGQTIHVNGGMFSS